MVVTPLENKRKRRVTLIKSPNRELVHKAFETFPYDDDSIDVTFSACGLTKESCPQDYADKNVVPNWTLKFGFDKKQGIYVPSGETYAILPFHLKIVRPTQKDIGRLIGSGRAESILLQEQGEPKALETFHFGFLQTILDAGYEIVHGTIGCSTHPGKEWPEAFQPALAYNGLHDVLELRVAHLGRRDANGIKDWFTALKKEYSRTD